MYFGSRYACITSLGMGKKVDRVADNRPEGVLKPNLLGGGIHNRYEKSSLSV